MSGDIYQCEAVVIGAGAVGLACAAALARRGMETLVLEHAATIGTGISSRNSEVVHAGIYYPTGSLKHRLCIEGRRRLYAYLSARGVAHRVFGKWIVATNAAEEGAIQAIHARAEANGVEGLRYLTGGEAQTLEPALNCVAAIESRETGVFDSHGYMLALLGEIEDRGGSIAFNTPVARAEILPHGGYAIDAGETRIECKMLINSAGLRAHRIARALDGYNPALLPPFRLAKGSYFGCAGKPAFSRLIYPAPVDGGLGVHVTLDLGGRMRFGPDVEWLDHDDPDAVDYAVDNKRAESFYAAIRRYWPALPDGVLTGDYSGCRPKLSGPGEAAADFRIDGPALHGHEGLVHLFGIESPGLTSSLAIAERVADAAMGRDASKREALKAAVFFDRDGTLNRDAGYTFKPEDLRWNAGAIEAVRAVNDAGRLAVVVTNQSGIGRGLFDEAAMHRFHARMEAELAAAGARIDAWYFAPHHPEAASEALRHPNHPDRKPNPGMILRALREHGIDPARSLLIGDSPADLAAARASGVMGVAYRGENLAELVRKAMGAAP